MITNSGKFYHITPALRDLQWLPVRQKPLVFKSLHGLAKSYLTSVCRQVPKNAGAVIIIIITNTKIANHIPD